MMRTYRTTETALADIAAKHGNKITALPTFSFTNVDKKETFVCKEHGEFESTVYRLLKSKGYGCNKCSPFGPKGWEYMKQKIFNKHGDRYEYYLNDDTYTAGSKLKIICRKHGVFYQNYGDHVTGTGCPTCSKEEKEVSVNDFLLNAITHHGNSYGYDYVFEDYTKAASKVRIICPKHGIFLQQANDHGRGSGCPSCSNASRGENLIRNFLIRNKIEYTTQKTFPDCVRNKGKLKYDFYLPAHNILIEYDGKQHFETGFLCQDLDDIKATDEFKTKYAADNGFVLLRLRYDDNSLQILQTMLA
jgi:very-short-patch-repair endonuclease